MFGSSIITPKISLPNIINGISKTLNVTSKVIPMYQKAQPLFKNAKSILGMFKNISIIDKKEVSQTNQYNNNSQANSASTLVFFQ